MKKIYFALLALSLGACKEKISIDIPDSNPLLVVEGEVTTEIDSSFVRLTLSSNYFSAENPRLVQNAQVSVNGVPFLFEPITGTYKPFVGYVGKTDSTYNLLINYDSKTYSAYTKLERMFRIDSFFQTYKKAEGFLEAGYSISYAAFDDRPVTKYTYFKSGIYSTVIQSDSMDENQILFDNSLTPANKPYVFEIPFTRFQTGDTYIAIFRSIDKNMFDFINAYGFQSPDIPGPFQVPPANLPTNIQGGGVGYFAGYDVKRYRYTFK